VAVITRTKVLFGLGIFLVTIGGVVVVQGIVDTTRALLGGGSNGRPRADAPSEGAVVADEDGSRGRSARGAQEVREPREPRGEIDPNAHLAPAEGAPASADGDAKAGAAARTIGERAEDRGLTPHELRERIATKQGLTVDQFRDRRQARSEWRAEQDPGSLRDRKDARDERHAQMTPEELEALDAARQARRELAEQDPTLKGAADVLKQLREAGEAPAAPP
jgi:hypothetical protein